MQVRRWMSATRFDDLIQNQVVQPKESIQLMQVRRGCQPLALTTSAKIRSCSPRNQFNSCKSNDGRQPLKLTSPIRLFTWTSSTQQFTLTSSSHQFTWMSSTQLFTLMSSFPQFTWMSSTLLFTLTSSSHQSTWTSSTQLFILTSSPINQHGRALLYYSH